MGTQVITRDTGRRLGVVGEVIVDIDRREVVAVGLRDNPLTRFLPAYRAGCHSTASVRWGM
jgi:sporulation protein YlmC with PRC-barrel domain